MNHLKRLKPPGVRTPDPSQLRRSRRMPPLLPGRSGCARAQRDLKD